MLFEPRIPYFLQDLPQNYFQLFELAAKRGGGLNLEFGVGHGLSMLILREFVPADQIIYGFDSFKGLPEAWNDLWEGAFKLEEGEQPVALPNVVLVGGWFQDTVPLFAADAVNVPINFMHIDCDLYASTKCVLSGFNNNIVPGTMIFFDEYFGYPDWRKHEHLAFMEFIEETKRTFDYLGTDGQHRVCVEMTS